MIQRCAHPSRSHALSSVPGIFLFKYFLFHKSQKEIQHHKILCINLQYIAMLLIALASSPWAPDCDLLRLHSRVPTAHVWVTLCIVSGGCSFLGPVSIPEDCSGEGEKLLFRSTAVLGTEVGSRYLSKLGTCPHPAPQSASCSRGAGNVPFWVELHS